jgi:hypothetical protein
MPQGMFLDSLHCFFTSLKFLNVNFIASFVLRFFGIKKQKKIDKVCDKAHDEDWGLGITALHRHFRAGSITKITCPNRTTRPCD